MTALMLAGAMTASMGTFAFADEAKELPTIDSIKLGEDYTDLTATIKVLTHRTDIVDTTFQDYIKKFNESYPNITIEYEAVTDYAEDIKLRLTTDDWGDICGIPTNLQKNELEDEFISYGDKETLDENYVLLNNLLTMEMFTESLPLVMHRVSYIIRRYLRKQELQSFQRHQPNLLKHCRRLRTTQMQFRCTLTSQQAGPWVHGMLISADVQQVILTL